VNVKKLYRLIEAEKKRKVPKGRLAKEIYDEEMEKASRNPGGLRDQATHRMCDEIFGFRPLLVPGGDKGVDLMARFQAQADFEEGIADEMVSKSKGLIRPGAGSVDPEEAALKNSRSAAQKASVKRAAEREALKALGPPEETITVCVRCFFQVKLFVKCILRLHMIECFHVLVCQYIYILCFCHMFFCFTMYKYVYVCIY